MGRQPAGYECLEAEGLPVLPRSGVCYSGSPQEAHCAPPQAKQQDLAPPDSVHQHCVQPDSGEQLQLSTAAADCRARPNEANSVIAAAANETLIDIVIYLLLA